MSKKLKNKLIGFVSSVAVIVVAILLDKLQIIDIKEYIDVNSTYEENETDFQAGVLYDVVRVVDGDTFVVKYNGKDEKVRLIGVDTPESVHPDEEKNTEFGDKVSNFTKEMLTGKQVDLEFDVEQKDQYGRLLAYVYLDGQMYNKMLLEKGYAQVATYPPNVKYVDDFTAIQKQAREDKVGLWEY